MANFETRGFFPLLISLSLYVFLGPVLLVLILLNEVVRLLISIYFLQKYNGKVYLVPDGADAIWALKRKERTRMVLIGLKLDHHITPQKLQHCFRDQILQARDPSGERIYSKFEKILITKFGYACWKQDEHFNIKNHIRSLSPTKIYTKKDIQKELINLFQDMSESHPQWELITVARYVENAGESETSLLIYRGQHAYMDGFSLSTMFKKHMSTNYTHFIHPQKFALPPGKKFLFYLNAVIFGPYAFLLVTLNKFKSFWPRQTTSQTKFSYTWTNSVEFGTIQKLRKKLDFVTLPTIVENAFISAAKEVLPEGRIPEILSIGELAALLPYPDYGPHNRFAVFMYAINSTERDLERIRESKKESWKGITGPWIPLSFWVFKISGRMPVITHYVVFGGGSSSLMMSNLPLSRTRFRMLDTADVLEVWAFPPLPNDTGIMLFSSVVDNTCKMTASAESSWLTEEELDRIMERLPNIIKEWAQSLE